MAKKYPGQLVFGLDIGTRSIVGTVGYRNEDRFVVVAQKVQEHETRSMLDGQIHDIGVVGKTISKVKEALEKEIDSKLTDVCIAAAGRVLRTVQVRIEKEFEAETEITEENIVELTTAGIEKAYLELPADAEQNLKFYCVGFTIQKYFVNDNAILNPEQHKARKLSADMIATFLPDDVVDGLYKATANAGLNVANLTLEPIAAIQVAIPQNYRMLNIALIDVGAGTSDICITKDGMVTAYGMIPIAGDSITEAIAQSCLVDFDTAEQIKRGICEKDSVEYKDIMGLKQVAKRKDILESIHTHIEKMAVMAADKIKELNGDKTVSAVFVVGGGGKILGYTDLVAKHLEIPKERCAIRGEDVMGKIDFTNKNIIKDSLMVTPIGICLSFFEQSNRFVFVTFNNERVKLYDNNHLAVVDAAMQAEFDNENLFPKRGKELEFFVNGKKHMVRGELGEPAVITVNGKAADMHTPIRKNDVIEVIPSTAGKEATMQLVKVPDISASLRVVVNEKVIVLPAFAKVNGQFQTEYYELCSGDQVEIIQYYTVGQIAECMDVVLKKDMNIYVNNKLAELDTKVYNNFSVIWTMEELQLSDVDKEGVPESFEDLLSDEERAQREKDKELDAEEQRIEEEKKAALEAKDLLDEAAADALLDKMEKTKMAKVALDIEKMEEMEERERADSENADRERAGSEKADRENAGRENAGRENADRENAGSENADNDDLAADIVQAAAEAKTESETKAVSEAKTESETKAASEEKVESETKETSDAIDAPEAKTAETSKQTEVERMMAAADKGEVYEAPHEQSDAYESASKVEGLKAGPGLEAAKEALEPEECTSELPKVPHSIVVIVNQKAVTLEGKAEYVFVDIFDKIEFDLSKPKGKEIITNLNGRRAQFMENINEGDKMEVYWKN